MKVRVVSTKDKNTGDHHKERYGGVSLFDRLGVDPIELARTRVIASPSVTHLRFSVVRAA